MIAPALLDHVTEELYHEANVLKERRKMCDGGPLQSTIDKRANEIQTIKSEQGAAADTGTGRHYVKGSS